MSEVKRIVWRSEEHKVRFGVYRDSGHEHDEVVETTLHRRSTGGGRFHYESFDVTMPTHSWGKPSRVVIERAALEDLPELVATLQDALEELRSSGWESWREKRQREWDAKVARGEVNLDEEDEGDD